ncbi:unnamed protein product [Schistosoma curassoni]|nr:unnamed protein product [Schistosoma curassoni]
MTRRYSKYNSTVNALSEQLSECTEDMLKLTIKK